MSESIGVGILTYYGLDDVKRAVASVQQHGRCVTHLLVFDNSENDEVGAWATALGDGVAYVRSPYNCGCARGRNRMSEWFIARGVSHFVLQDQDVEWAGDAAAAMRAVFARHPDTGIVSWHLATRQMSGGHKAYQPDKTGAIIETPGMCCMYSAKCVKAVGGWDQRMLMYRFDTLFCLRALKAGFKTRVVWPDTNLVRHHHPHKGVQRYLWVGLARRRSQAIFKQEIEEHGLARPPGM